MDDTIVVVSEGQENINVTVSEGEEQLTVVVAEGQENINVTVSEGQDNITVVVDQGEEPLHVTVDEGYTLPSAVSLMNNFNFNFTSCYKEFVEAGSKITQINYFLGPTKEKKLFTKTITYSGENPTSVAIKDEIGNKTLTKTINYLGNKVTNVLQEIT